MSVLANPLSRGNASLPFDAELAMLRRLHASEQVTVDKDAVIHKQERKAKKEEQAKKEVAKSDIHAFQKGHHHYGGCKNDTQELLRQKDCECVGRANNHMQFLHGASDANNKKFEKN
jgi:hypothetical protein